MAMAAGTMSPAGRAPEYRAAMAAQNAAADTAHRFLAFMWENLLSDLPTGHIGRSGDLSRKVLGMDRRRSTYQPRHLARRSKMDEVRGWLMQMPGSAARFALGAVVGQLIAETFEPEIAVLADWIRTFIGLQ